MTASIRVELGDARAGADLVETLARRGLTGSLRRGAGRWEVVISYEHEETERLLCDVAMAVEAWLEGHEALSIDLRVGERGYTITRAGPAVEPGKKQEEQ